MGGRAQRDRRAPEDYALYLGKLAPNKGTDYLVDVVTKADLDWRLIVAGDGPDRAVALERAARASGRAVEFRGWMDRPESIRRVSGAAVLIFPSRGPESLSRVLPNARAPRSQRARRRDRGHGHGRHTQTSSSPA